MDLKINMASLIKNFVAAFSLFFFGVEGCYYNHELTVSDFLLKWRDVPSGPLPGMGFEISHDKYIFELEGQDVTSISVGDKKYEFSVPFTYNEVELHQKSLCGWGYGCAHCQHVAEDACGSRLTAISMLSDHLNEMVDGTDSSDDGIPSELPVAFDTMIAGLTELCDECVNLGDEEEYVTNDIIESCYSDCLSV